jgi:hypothetical protein
MDPTKPLMTVSQDILKDLATKSQTGMGFYVVESSEGWLIILENGDAMPLTTHTVFFFFFRLANRNPSP